MAKQLRLAIEAVIQTRTWSSTLGARMAPPYKKQKQGVLVGHGPQGANSNGPESWAGHMMPCVIDNEFSTDFPSTRLLSLSSEGRVGCSESSVLNVLNTGFNQGRRRSL